MTQPIPPTTTWLFPSALGLDIGKKRIGVAGCDRLGLFATGLTTIARQSLPQVIAELRQIIQARGVTILVIGLPYQLDGTMGAQAKNIRKTGKTIAKAVNLPIAWVDERLTSYAAEELLKAENIAPSRHKAAIDRKAAAIILQEWLDTQARIPEQHHTSSVHRVDPNETADRP